MRGHKARVEAAKRYAALGEEAVQRREFQRAAALYRAALWAITGVQLDAEGSAHAALDAGPAAVDSRGKTPHRCTNTRPSARGKDDPTTSIIRLVSGVRDAEADEQPEDKTG